MTDRVIQRIANAVREAYGTDPAVNRALDDLADSLARVIGDELRRSTRRFDLIGFLDQCGKYDESESRPR